MAEVYIIAIISSKSSLNAGDAKYDLSASASIANFSSISGIAEIDIEPYVPIYNLSRVLAAASRERVQEYSALISSRSPVVADYETTQLILINASLFSQSSARASFYIGQLQEISASIDSISSAHASLSWSAFLESISRLEANDEITIEDKSSIKSGSGILAIPEILIEDSADILSISDVKPIFSYFIASVAQTILANGFYFRGLGGGSDYQPFKAKIVTYKQYAQNPIKADELVYTCSIHEPAPALQQVIFVDQGEHVFNGLITKAEDNKNFWKITCRSMAYTLDFRRIPEVVYGAGLALNDILSSDLPSLSPPKIGVLFLISSTISEGLWTAYNAYAHKLPKGGLKSQIQDSDLYVFTSMPFITDFDAYDGIIHLSEVGNIPPGPNQSSRDEDYLYIRVGDDSYWPNAFHVAAPYKFDCQIRFGGIDIGEYTNTIPFSLGGLASKNFDDFFINIGRELQFKNGLDGCVYMFLAAECSRGSPSSPVRYINDGEDDFRILRINQKDPNVQAAIGIDSNDAAQPEYSITDYDKTSDIQLFKVFDRKGAEKDETLFQLQQIIDNNDDSFSATSRNVDWHLKVGDWLVLHRDDYGTFQVRIREIDYDNGIQSLICGKRLFTVSNKFGEYLRKSIPSRATPIQTTALAGGAGSFVIKASDVQAGGLVIYFEDSFDTSNESDISVQVGSYCDLLINSKIVPPGRIKLIDQTSVKIDITDYCNMSSSVDTTNTVTRNFYQASGWSSQGAKITQWRALKFLSPL